MYICSEYNAMKNKADQLRKQVRKAIVDVSLLELFNVTQHAHQEGHKLGLEDETRRIQRDLDSDLYRDADSKYLHRAGDIKACNYHTVSVKYDML